MIFSDNDPNLFYLYEVVAMFDGEIKKILDNNMDLRDPNDLQEIFRDVFMFYSRGLIGITNEVSRGKYVS